MSTQQTPFDGQSALPTTPPPGDAEPAAALVPDFDKMKKAELVAWLDETHALNPGHFSGGDEQVAALKKTTIKKLKAELKALFPTGASLEDPEVTGFDPTDVLHKTVAEVEAVEDEAKAIELVEAAQDAAGFQCFRIGGLLARMQAKGWQGEYEDFWGFAEGTFGYRIRKTQILIRTYTKLVEIGATSKDIEGIGWTKLDAISGVLTKENAAEWFAKARELPILALKEEVKAAAGGAGDGTSSSSTNSGEDTFKSMKFRVPTDSVDVVEEGLKKAGEEGGTEDPGTQLTYAMLGFLNAGAVAAPASDEAQQEEAAAPVVAPEGTNPFAQTIEQVDLLEVFKHYVGTHGDAGLEPIFDALTSAYEVLDVDVFPAGYPAGYKGYSGE